MIWDWVKRLDSIAFDEGPLYDFFGMVHFLVGTELYTLFCVALWLILAGFGVGVLLAGYRILNPLK